MGARYLIRFDDLCPTMNWTVWEEIEKILSDAEVAPILSVVPENADEHLRVQPPNPGFWDRVRAWQGRGWEVGMHGYEHRYVTPDPGIVGLNQRSEFAGLARGEQETKLRSALDVFRREGLTPRTWVAPSHSFDATTVDVLHELGIRIISDGFFFFPHVDSRGMLWIPQQLWGFRPVPFGVWTVCLHHNGWTEKTLARFRDEIRLRRESIASVDAIVKEFADRPRGWSDPWIARSFLAAMRAKKLLRGLARRGASSGGGQPVQ